MEDQTSKTIYSWESPGETQSRAMAVSATLVAMAVLLTANFITTTAGATWGFTMTIGERTVLVPWLGVAAAMVPLAIAIALRAIHFVAVVLIAVLLLVVVPALLAGYMPVG